MVLPSAFSAAKHSSRVWYLAISDASEPLIPIATHSIHSIAILFLAASVCLTAQRAGSTISNGGLLSHGETFRVTSAPLARTRTGRL